MKKLHLDGNPDISCLLMQVIINVSNIVGGCALYLGAPLGQLDVRNIYNNLYYLMLLIEIKSRNLKKPFDNI
jgi:hypothetical protein